MMNKKKNKIVLMLIIFIAICTIFIASICVLTLVRGTTTYDPALPEETEIAEFNLNFTPYEGKQSGLYVNKLAQSVLLSNRNERDNAHSYFVTVKGAINIDKDSTNFEKVDNSKSYIVTFNYDEGRVNEITITSEANAQQ